MATSTPIDLASEVVCPGCEQSREFISKVVLNGRSRLSECPGCGTWVYFPRPTRREQADKHDAAAYYEHPYFKNRRTDMRVPMRRCRAAFGLISTALDLKTLRGEAVLDVGCDTGAFLRAAQELYGICPVGLDVSERAVAGARAAGIRAYHADIASAPPELAQLRLITAIDLIEHVVSPAEFLRDARERLTIGGVLYLETPNIASVVYQAGSVLTTTAGSRLSSLVDRLFPAEHIEYFNARSLADLAARTGFEVLVVRSRPLPPQDIVASRAIQLGMAALQVVDRWRQTGILLCAVLRRKG